MFCSVISSSLVSTSTNTMTTNPLFIHNTTNRIMTCLEAQGLAKHSVTVPTIHIQGKKSYKGPEKVCCVSIHSIAPTKVYRQYTPLVSASVLCAALSVLDREYPALGQQRRFPRSIMTTITTIKQNPHGREMYAGHMSTTIPVCTTSFPYPRITYRVGYRNIGHNGMI